MVLKFTATEEIGRDTGLIERYADALTRADFEFRNTTPRKCRWPEQGVEQMRSDFTVLCPRRGDRKRAMTIVNSIKSTPFTFR